MNSIVVILFMSCSDPPNVMARDPTEVIVNQTQSASFSCEAFGIPLTTIVWINDSSGSNVTNSTGAITITTTVLPPITLLSVLTFLNTTRPDQSSYTCVGSNGVSNLIGTPENATVFLFVQGKECCLIEPGMCYNLISFIVPALIVANPTNITHFAGGNISLQCTASGIPTPTITWLKNGQSLPISDDGRVSVDNTMILDTPNQKTILSRLVFQGLLLTDDADYRCEANNTGANDNVFKVTSQTAHLTVQRERNVPC